MQRYQVHLPSLQGVNATSSVPLHTNVWILKILFWHSLWVLLLFKVLYQSGLMILWFCFVLFSSLGCLFLRFLRLLQHKFQYLCQTSFGILLFFGRIYFQKIWTIEVISLSYQYLFIWTFGYSFDLGVFLQNSIYIFLLLNLSWESIFQQISLPFFYYCCY